MPISSAAQGVAAIRLGTTPITRVYAGTNLLYDANASTTIVPATLRSVTTANVAYNNASKIINRPAGTTAGDLLLLVMYCDYGAAANFKVPTGFTTLNTRELAANGDKQVVGYKIATGSEPSNYTMSVPTDADLRADLLCIQDADTAAAPMINTAATASSTSSHTAPAVTPGSAHGLLVCSVGFSASSSGKTFSWTPPSGMTERTDASTNGYVTQTTATQAWATASAVPAKTFTLTTTSTASQGIGASIVVPSRSSGGAVTPPPEEPTGYVAVASNGSTGSFSDAISTNRTFVDSAGTSGRYRFWGSHIPTNDRTGPLPLVIHLHGDGAWEYDNPTTWTSPLYMQVAKDIGGIGLIPEAMDLEYDLRSWWSGTRGADWVGNLIVEMMRLYNIDKRQVYLSGFSGGAVILGSDIMTRHHAKFLGGGAMLLGGGQAGTIVGTPSAQLKADFPMRWHVGTDDDGTTEADGYNARAAAESGELYYRNQGFNTALTYIQNEDHEESEDDGPAAFRALVNISRNRYGLPTI